MDIVKIQYSDSSGCSFNLHNGRHAHHCQNVLEKRHWICTGSCAFTFHTDVQAGERRPETPLFFFNNMKKQLISPHFPENDDSCVKYSVRTELIWSFNLKLAYSFKQWINFVIYLEVTHHIGSNVKGHLQRGFFLSFLLTSQRNNVGLFVIIALVWTRSVRVTHIKELAMYWKW